MDLQDTFYVIGIIFMSIMLILIIALVVGVFIIRARIIAIQKQIQSKIDEATDLAAKGGEIAAHLSSKAASATVNKIKGAVKSNKRRR